MANNKPNTETEGKPKDPKKQLSLSQAILSPLDSIFQAQIHAARSFLNMLLQIGYPHIPINPEGKQMIDEHTDPEKFKPYEIDFNFKQNDADGKPQTFKASIPALALVPLNSLAVSEAEFNFGFKVNTITKFQQIQQSELPEAEREKNPEDQKDKKKGEGKKDNSKDEPDPMTDRKWNLVKNPKSMEGEIWSKPNDQMKETSQEAIIDISIKLAKTPIPAALDNLLVHLTKSVIIQKQEENKS